MSLKRKRSADSVSLNSLTSSTTMPSRDPSSSPPIGSHMRRSRDSTGLNSRTIKRYRDNRPEEGTMHRNTCDILFAAARSPPNLNQPQPTQHSSSRPSLVRQSSLHTFWSIQSSEPLALAEPPKMEIPRIQCQDCDTSFTVPDVDVSMGGMEEFSGNEEWICRECRRVVCDGCAVVEIGIGRECLQCRTSGRKKWIGGIGWMA